MSHQIDVPGSLLSAIYEAACDPGLWRDVTGRATEWVGGIAGSLQARKLSGRPETLLVSTGIEDSHHASYLEHHHRHDPHLAHVKELAVGRALLSAEVVATRDLVRTEFYNDFWLPQGLFDLQGAVVVRNKNWAVSLACFGPRVDHFDEASRQRLAALAPHLARSLALGFHFDGLDAAEPALTASTQLRTVHLLRVDASLHLVEACSGSSEQLCAGEHALSIEHNRLRAHCTPDQDRLQDAIRAALSGVASLHQFGEGDGALQVAFAPGPRTSPIGRERCVTVVIALAQDACAPQRRFGALPVRLRAVARCLALGLSDKEIASEIAASLTTTRTYVARVMKRLQVKGRRELMQTHLSSIKVR